MSGGDDDGPEAYREQVRVARKLHKCCACEIPIRVGDRYQLSSGVWDGRGSSYKHCLRCARILDVLCDHGENPLMELNCGHSWKERFEADPPPEIEALAFLTIDEIQALHGK